MTIRIGVIGAGPEGREYMRHLSELPDAEIVAVCDNDRARAETVAEPHGASAYINFRTLLEAEHLDAMFVCLPPFSSGEPEILAARAGIHMFVHAPVAVNIQKARQIQAEIEKSGVLASVAYPWRYLSGVDYAKELLADQKIGIVRGCDFGATPRGGWRCSRESAGSYFLQEASDLIDMARYLAGDIVSVSAMEFAGIVSTRNPDCDIEDALAAVVRFRSGAVGEFISADIAPSPEHSLSVIADRLEVTVTAEAIRIKEPGKETLLKHAGIALRTAEETFLEAVTTGKGAIIRSDYGDAVRTMEVAVTATESAQTGKIINL